MGRVSEAHRSRLLLTPLPLPSLQDADDLAVVMRSDGLASHHQLSVSFVLPNTKPFARCDVWSARPACGDVGWFDPNAGPQSCDAHSQCAALGLRGACCPTADGTMLDCCSADDAAAALFANTSKVASEAVVLGSVLESTYAAFVASFPLLCEGYGRPSDRDTPGGGDSVDCVGNCETGRGYCYATRDSFGRDICANCVLWDPQSARDEVLCDWARFGPPQGGPLPGTEAWESSVKPDGGVQACATELAEAWAEREDVSGLGATTCAAPDSGGVGSSVELLRGVESLMTVQVPALPRSSLVPGATHAQLVCLDGWSDPSTPEAYPASSGGVVLSSAAYLSVLQGATPAEVGVCGAHGSGGDAPVACDHEDLASDAWVMVSTRTVAANAEDAREAAEEGDMGCGHWREAWEAAVSRPAMGGVGRTCDGFVDSGEVVSSSAACGAAAGLPAPDGAATITRFVYHFPRRYEGTYPAIEHRGGGGRVVCLSVDGVPKPPPVAGGGYVDASPRISYPFGMVEAYAYTAAGEAPPVLRVREPLPSGLGLDGGAAPYLQALGEGAVDIEYLAPVGKEKLCEW